MATTKTSKETVTTFATAAMLAGGSAGLLLIVLKFLQLGLMSSGDPADAQRFWWLGALGWAMLTILLTSGVVLLGLAGVALRRTARVAEHQTAHLERIESLLEHQGADLRNLASMASLSDQAKGLINYERELEALRETVNAMLLKQDYKSAEAIVERMESRLGLVDEATRIREDIDNARRASVDDRIQAAAKRVGSLLGRQQWAQAKREAERLLALFPENAQIKSLPKQIQSAWTAYKGKLLKDYGQAVRINDVERSIDLLKELDKYLTPQEGAALAESARDVFKKKLHNFGVQFAIQLADQQWSNAVSTGEEIIQEFPNSRMAREVREKIDLLRDYASGARQPAPPSIIDHPDAGDLGEEPTPGRNS
jgi:hypothetical protein